MAPVSEPGMDRMALYKCIGEAGCQVLAFEDHPQFFGNWLVRFKHGREGHEVVCDKREGWMTLWHQIDDRRSERLHEVEATCLGPG
jgi:hypothetical protein